MKKKQGNYITEILGNDVSWYVESPSVTSLSGWDEDHIADMIKEGYSCGEIVTTFRGKNGREYDTRGWWHIIKWQDIALQLYNRVKAIGFKQPADIEAIKRFDDEWTF